MKHTLTLLTSMLLAPLAAVNAADAPKPSLKPNVILFLVDDLGYSDIAPFGSKIHPTPLLSRLADEGVKFTHFYNASTACSPSRSALMTGCYAERVGMDGKVCFPSEPKALHPAEYTMAEMLRDAGYATGCFGKWHLGHKPGFLPPAHGFDEFCGIPYSNDMWTGKPSHSGKEMPPYPPLPLLHGNEVVAAVLTGEDQSHLTQVFHRAALDFIRANQARPFFAYIPFSAVHAPRFAQGGEREDALSRQVQEIDDCVGRTLALLKELRLDQQTLVLFLSDNGGGRGTSIAPLRGEKAGRPFEGHQRTSFLAWWPGRIPAGTVTSQIASSMDLFPTLAELAGGKLPSAAIDGRDISTLLLEPATATSPHERIRYTGGNGLREGKWKLLRITREWSLFDLEKDPGEQTDIASQHPDHVSQMQARLTAWTESLQKEARPHAQMPDLTPLIAPGEEGHWPTLTEWQAQQSGKAADQTR
jgi:arylsulfatase A-like enzyme